MSYKLYSRLVGKIATAQEALGLTSPPATTTPFNEQSPGTKFMAYGEDATSLAFNRAFAALSTNIDSVHSLLGTPSLRSEVLRPGYASEPGFPSLKVTQGLQSSIDLSAEGSPATWVFVGNSIDSLARNTRLFNIDGEQLGEASIHGVSANPDIAFSNFSISPTNATEKPSASPYEDSIYFPNIGDAGAWGADLSEYWPPEELGTHKTGTPYFVPPVRRVQSNVAPYNGAHQKTQVNHWEPDGLYVRKKTIEELCLRPGCFVEIQNSGTPVGNNGLFRIENIVRNTVTTPDSSGSKIVLSRGNLHKITVDNDVFTPGELVSWQDAPNRSADSTDSASDRTNFAHVLFTYPRPDISADAVDIYLSTESGPNNWQNNGDGSDKISDGSGGTKLKSVSSYGNIGLADQEEGAEQNNALPKGTIIYNAMSTKNKDDSTAGSAAVLSTIPAGYPVVFDTTVSPGQMIPCTPPGFLLNPVLYFTEDVLPGNNYLWTKTLTTVGEQLASRGGGYNNLAVEDSSSEPFMTRGDVKATNTFLSHIHTGGNPVVDTEVNGPKTPTANILGPSIWKVTVQRVDGLVIAGNPSVSESLAAQGDEIGKDFFTFQTGPDDYFVCRALPSTGGLPVADYNGDGIADQREVLYLTDVLPLYHHQMDLSEKPVRIGARAKFSNKAEYMIMEVHDFPVISDEGQLIWLDDVNYIDLSTKGKSVTGNNFCMSHGLNAAFHAQNSANPLARGLESGIGNIIYVPGGSRDPSGRLSTGNTHRPFTTVLGGEADYEVAHLTVTGQRSVLLAALANDDNDIIAEIGHHNYNELQEHGTLFFSDRNTNEPGRGGGGKIDFSADVVDATYSMHNHRDLPSEVHDRSILGALEAHTLGNFDDTFSSVNFGLVSNGVLWGMEALHPDDPEVPKSLLPVLGDTRNTLRLTEGYVYCGGAKNHVSEANLYLDDPVYADGGSGTAIVHYNVATHNYEVTVYEKDTLLYRQEKLIPICSVGFYSDAGVPRIYDVVDIRERLCHINKRDEIYVGRTHNEHFNLGGAFSETGLPTDTGLARQGGMHFPTIGGAIAAIEVLNNSYKQKRSWTINVVGETHEVANILRGIEYPIRIPFGGITIVGHGGQTRSTRGIDTFTKPDELRDPVVHVYGESLFDLNGQSDLTFRNIAIQFDQESWEDLSTDDKFTTLGVSNVFVNTKTQQNAPAWFSLLPDQGGGLDITRVNEPFNVHADNKGELTASGINIFRHGATTYPDALPFQKNITIESVHVSGPHHSFFYHGARRDKMLAGMNATQNECPFDNLVIRDCSSTGGYHSFVNIAPSNSLNSIYNGNDNGYAASALQSDWPYFWRNITIENCEIDQPYTEYIDWKPLVWEGNLGTLEERLFLDAIHLSACKEVTVRNCSIKNSFRAIHLGVGNWTHYSTGSIENNTIIGVISDAITAFSESEVSGISIRNNYIADWGTPSTVDYGVWHRDFEDESVKRQNRFAAIKIAANAITVEGNTLVDNRRCVPLWSADKTTIGDFSEFAPTQGIYISDDISKEPGGGGWRNSGLWGIKILNNSMVRTKLGGAFIYSSQNALIDCSFNGNSFRVDIPGSFPFSTENYSHPVFAQVYETTDWTTGDFLDPIAIDTKQLENSNVSNNNLCGHVSIDRCLASKISDNNFTFPNSVVKVDGGHSLSFTDNNLSNGIFICTSTNLQIQGNAFKAQSNHEDYFDIYKGAIDQGVTPLFSGIYLNLVRETAWELGCSATLIGNQIGPSPYKIVTIGGDLNEEQSYQSQHGVIYLGSVDLDSHVVLSSNIVYDAMIETQATSNLAIDNNMFIGTKTSSVPTLRILNTNSNPFRVPTSGLPGNPRMYTSEAYKLTFGTTDVGISLTNNKIFGDVHINGTYGFDTWTSLVEAFSTGSLDSREWKEDPTDTVGTSHLHYIHSKIRGATIRGNTVNGNIELIGVMDTSISDNSLIGALNTSLAYSDAIRSDARPFDPWTSELVYESDGLSSVELFTKGQIQVLACNRLLLSNNHLASLYVLHSKAVRASNCIFGHREVNHDIYGKQHVTAVATYTYTNQGRVYAAFSPHFTVESCNITDAKIDVPPDMHYVGAQYEDFEFFHPYGFGGFDDALERTGAYMNRFDATVYSTNTTMKPIGNPSINVEKQPVTFYSTYNSDEDAWDVYTEYPVSYADRYLVDLVIQSCPAFSLSGCHLGRAIVSASDDAKIHNNRFYYGGDEPTFRNNLVVNESSMRPQISNNHFTSSIEVGDRQSWRTHRVQANADEAMYHTQWTIMLESIVRHAVHAQITGNRFDSAVGAQFDHWKRDRVYLTQLNHYWYAPEGARNGCGNLEMWNYGGSLISNNHMMKSPYGYLMHAADNVLPHSDAFDSLSEFLEGTAHASPMSPSEYEFERRDSKNRIGGEILLDASGYYNPNYYTVGAVYAGLIDVDAPHHWGTYADTPNGWTGLDENGKYGIFTYTDAANAYLKIGTGLNTGYGSSYELNTWSIDRTNDVQTADAPEPWRVNVIIPDISLTLGDFDAELSGATKRYIGWGGVHVMNWFASTERVFQNFRTEFELIDTNRDGVVDDTLPDGSYPKITVSVKDHYPKTLGSFVIGNLCKRIIMNDKVRQSSWAYGRHCDIRVDHYPHTYQVSRPSGSPSNHVDFTPVLPAQAYETPINPMHANNHSQFNMLRYKDETIDLCINGNFGSYIVRSNPGLEKEYGFRRPDVRSSATGPTIPLEWEDIRWKKEVTEWDGTTRWLQRQMFSPEAPASIYLSGVNYRMSEGPYFAPHAVAAECDPWTYEWYNNFNPGQPEPFSGNAEPGNVPSFVGSVINIPAGGKLGDDLPGITNLAPYYLTDYLGHALLPDLTDGGGLAVIPGD